MVEFTREQKHKAANREVGMRRRVYPGLVARGKLAQHEADYGIAIMQAIAEDYRGQPGLSLDNPNQERGSKR